MIVTTDGNSSSRNDDDDDDDNGNNNNNNSSNTNTNNNTHNATCFRDELWVAKEQERQKGAPEVRSVQRRLRRVVHVLAPRAIDLHRALACCCTCDSACVGGDQGWLVGWLWKNTAWTVRRRHWVCMRIALKFWKEHRAHSGIP